LAQLEAEMIASASAQAYERAAALRDKLEPLRWLDGRLSWLRDARQSHSFVYPITADDGQTLWYVIRRGQVQAVVSAPDDRRKRAAARKALSDVFERAIGPSSHLADQMDSILLVTSWFRRRPNERTRLMFPDEAIGLCGDMRLAI
jgi:excinuclease ABC subunit C